MHFFPVLSNFFVLFTKPLGTGSADFANFFFKNTKYYNLDRKYLWLPIVRRIRVKLLNSHSPFRWTNKKGRNMTTEFFFPISKYNVCNISPTVSNEGACCCKRKVMIILQNCRNSAHMPPDPAFRKSLTVYRGSIGKGFIGKWSSVLDTNLPSDAASRGTHTDRRASQIWRVKGPL
jgi:hypothetical protein